MADAKAVSDAGAFAVVLEGMAEPLAAKITAEIPIPTIGIGASPACDGQVLVMEDMLGLNPNPPKFVRQYAQLGPAIEAAVQAYAEDVRARRFPGGGKCLPHEKSPIEGRFSGRELNPGRIAHRRARGLINAAPQRLRPRGRGAARRAHTKEHDR